MNTTTEAFDDADQLGQVLQDTKGSDKLQFSTPADENYPSLNIPPEIARVF
jgi:hypothetical protein